MSRGPLFFLGAIFWTVAVAAGFTALMRYDNSPGASGSKTPSIWPPVSRLSRTAGLPTLIVALHPRCPCSRASLANLERAMPQLRGKAQIHLVFVHSAGEEPRDHTDLVQIAKAIPGTDIFQDETGREAELFGTLTSGEALLYSQEGNLLFHGGITFGRSHEGDNPGLSAIVAYIQHGVANRSSTPVFGCALTHTPKRDVAVTQRAGALQ